MYEISKDYTNRKIRQVKLFYILYHYVLNNLLDVPS